MHGFSVGIAVLAAVAIIGIGCWYLLTPSAAMKGFGLPLPEEGPRTLWWLRLKGTRDVVSGFVVFALLAWGETRILGIVLLIQSITALGDMSIVLAGKGSAKTALGVHGLTAAVIILGAIPLIAGWA